MSNKKWVVELSRDERNELTAFITKGTTVARKMRERPPRQPIFDGEAEAQLITLACSAPPDGHARWTIRMLAEKVVEMEIVETTHFNTVGRVLKKTRSNRT